MNRFELLAKKCNELQQVLVDKDFTLPHVNVGGGLGINYDQPDSEPIPDFDTYFGKFETHLALLEGQTLHFELGRSLVGQCGNLITRVLFTKPGSDTTFAILDAGMTELMRPALYRTPHCIEHLTRQEGMATYDVVGPICETSDAFARGLQLPRTERGDMLAIRSAGAYGEVMASRYNLRDPAPVVFSDDLAH